MKKYHLYTEVWNLFQKVILKCVNSQFGNFVVIQFMQSWFSMPLKCLASSSLYSLVGNTVSESMHAETVISTPLSRLYLPLECQRNPEHNSYAPMSRLTFKYIF